MKKAIALLAACAFVLVGCEDKSAPVSSVESSTVSSSAVTETSPEESTAEAESSSAATESSTSGDTVIEGSPEDIAKSCYDKAYNFTPYYVDHVTVSDDGGAPDIRSYVYDDYGNELYSYEGNVLPPSQRRDAYVEYSDSGKRTFFIIYTAGELDYFTNYEYNENGDVSLEKTYLASEDGYSVHRYEYEYDDKGSVTRVMKYDNDDEPLSTEYTYDDSGRVLTRLVDAKNSGEKMLTEYEYDEKGHLISEKTTELTLKRKVYEKTYENDDDGKCLIEHRVSGGESPMTFDTEYEYDSKGNVTLECTYIGDMEVSETSHIYSYFHR